MSKKKVETVEEFLARGGQIEQVPFGQPTSHSLRECKCGCKGDYIKHHHMRLMAPKKKLKSDKKWYSK